MVAACPFPYVPSSLDGSCTTTYATAAGSAYIITQIIWLICAIPLFLVATIQNIRLWRIKGVSIQLFINNLQHQIYGVCFLSSLFIMIRGSDPHGWGGKFWRHDIVLTDWSTIFAYTLLTLGACSWLKIIREISGKGKAAVETFQRVCIAFLTGSVFILSLLKAHANTPWIYSSIILFVIMIYNATLITIAWIYGYRIQQHLSRFSSSSNPNSAHNSAPTSPSQTTTTIKTPSREKKREGVTAHRKTVLTILKLLAAMTGVSILSIAFQWLGIIDSFNSHYDYTERPLDVPNFTFGGILMASIFVIAQAWCVAVALFFFRGLPTRGSGGATSSSHPHDTIQTGKGPTVGAGTTPRTIYQDDSPIKRAETPIKRVPSIPKIEPATTLRSTPTPIPNYARSPYTPAENSQRSSNGATSSSTCTPVATSYVSSSTPPGIPARLMFPPPPPPPQPFQPKPISNYEIDIEMV